MSTEASPKHIPLAVVDADGGLVPGAKQKAQDKIARNPVTFDAQAPLLRRSCAPTPW